MQWKQPKNNDKYHWTQHSMFKMQCYALSVQKVLGVIKKPERKEEGIVKKTIAVMQPVNPKTQNGNKIWKQEIWVMYQTCKAGKRKIQDAKPLAKPDKQIINSKFKIKNTRYQILNTKYKIISAWRYPGVSPKKNPIPEDILEELKGSI